MSYDTYIIIDTGGEHPATVEGIGNHTSNVGVIYRRVLPGPFKDGGKYWGVGVSNPTGGLPGLSGLPASVAAVHLKEALLKMVYDEEILRDLEPTNGWGSYDSGLVFMQNIFHACGRHPKGVLAVSW